MKIPCSIALLVLIGVLMAFPTVADAEIIQTSQALTAYFIKCLDSGDAPTAHEVEEYRKSAESGNAFAMTFLGMCYQMGVGVVADQDVAEKWYRKAAALGNADAMGQLGIMCEHEYANVHSGREKTPENAKELVEAFKWYQKAASKGGRGGMYCVGNCFASGRGVARNDAEAVLWFQKSAEAGCSAAMCELGERFLEGKGVEKNRNKAVSLLKKALELGDTDAKLALEKLQKQEHKSDPDSAEQ